jgi:hypothetical protein
MTKKTIPRTRIAPIVVSLNVISIKRTALCFFCFATAALLVAACSRNASGDSSVRAGSTASESSLEMSMNQTQPVVNLKLAIEKDSAHFQYELRNSLRQPIYVFDRLYDLRAKTLSPDWAYVTIEDQKALVSRQVWPLPQGLRHDSPETPYGRLVAPDSSVTGKFSLALPLIERDPYYSLLHANAKPSQVGIASVVLRMGWGIASELRAGSPVDLEGQKLVLFPYHEALSKQHFADSQTVSVKISATVSR